MFTLGYSDTAMQQNLPAWPPAQARAELFEGELTVREWQASGYRLSVCTVPECAACACLRDRQCVSFNVKFNE